MLFIYSSTIVCAQAPTTREYQIKAAFIFNFTQFTEFPAGSFSSPQAPFVIGVLGKNPFGSYLEQTVAGETVNGHPLVIQYYSNTDDIKGCHILFINLTDANKIEDAIDKLEGQNILTVGDAPYFLNNGGMIRFYTKNNKMQLQINLEAAKAANVVISSKLLRLAEIFTPAK